MLNRADRQKEIHENAVNKGFWEKQTDMRERLVLVVTELSEAVEADRKKKRMEAMERKYIEVHPFDAAVFMRYVHGTVEEELADAIIRLHDILGGYEIEWSNFPSYFKLNGDPFSVTVFGLMRMVMSSWNDGDRNDAKLLHATNALYEYAEHLEINIDAVIGWKMAYNKTREYMHGKGY